MGKLNGKVAFVTGAARGQGRSHAVMLASEGADIIAVDLCEQVDSVSYRLATLEDLEQTTREVEALDRRIIARQADVRDFDSLKLAVDAGVSEFGRLDIVSANAGILSVGAVEELPEQTWRDMIDINLTGVWQTSKVAIPHLVSGGRGGSIVLTSSVAGLKGFQHSAHYVSAKHGVTGLMKALALELAPHNIRVNSLHPTQVNTPMIMNEMLFQLFSPGVENPTVEDFAPASQAMNALPIPWVEAQDVSKALLFLVSDDARYVTGAALPIDAGVLLK